MKLLKIAGLLLCLASPNAFAQMTSQYTPYELDTLEAHLNKQWKRAEEIAAAYSKFKGIRQDLIVAVYQTEMKQWFNELHAWYNAWDPIIAKMKGNGLVDNAERDKTMKLLRDQEIELGRLRGRIGEINKKGDAALDALKSLPRFPKNYVDILESSSADNYEANLKLYHDQVDAAIAKVKESKEKFTSEILANLDQVTKGLDQAIETKAKALLTERPDLKVALQQLQEQIVQSRKADAIIARMKTRSDAISQLVNEDAIYTAQEQMAAWKAEIEAILASMKTDPKVSASVLDYTKTMLASVVGVREGQIADQLAQRDTLVIFAGYYEDQLYGSFGMVQKCLAEKRPEKIDCNRVRMIQGFNYEQLLQLTDKQAAYIESLLQKAKRGIYKI